MRKILHASLACLLFLGLFVGCSPSNKYTITFDTDGGTSVSNITVEKDKEVELPLETTKTGYKFNGWMDNTGRVVASTITVSENIALKASWISVDAETITVSFDSDGGTKVADLKVIKGETLKLPESPTKDGYTFRCWVDINEVPVYDDALLAEDTALKAIWERSVAETITIKFNSDGGSKVNDITITKGTNLKLPTPPTKVGYTFRVWVDQNENPIYDNALLDGSTTLKAVWDSNTITIKFNSDGGSKVNDITMTKGGSLKLPTPPTKQGCTFSVWVDQNSTPIYDRAKLSDSTTLKAIWNITITFNSDGGTSVDPITIQSGQGLTLPTPPTKSGYIFRVWMDQNETPVYDGALLGESTTLTAFWDNASTDTFRVTFDSNGGSKVADVLVVKGETLKLPDPPFRNGYTFQTWVDQYETPIYEGALLDGDINLKAVWIKN